MELLGEALIYLAAAVIAVPLADRLGLGSVLGYLIAGILVGPTFGLIEDDSSTVRQFGEFGVVMMLFLIGLELQPSMLWRMRTKLIGLGGLQLIGTTALIGGIAYGLGQTWQVSLAIGLILALSSTAIVLQTLSEKGLMRTQGGEGAFSVLLTQDIAVIPILAALPLLADPELLAHAGGHGSGGHGHGAGALAGLSGPMQAAAILGVIGLIVALGRFVMRPAFRYIAHAKLREIFTAASLLLIIGTTVGMELVGLSPALGAFLAGVVLSSSEYRHELESDIAPFKGLFLGLFFITVGAGIDFDLLSTEPTLILGLALALMLSKLIVLYPLGAVFKLGGSNRWLFALSLAQAGEFGFVLFGFATGAGVLGEELSAILVAAVAFSMLGTPLLFILFDRAVMPRFDKPDREPDEVEDTGTVIIAGVGRFGQVVNELLRACDHETVVLDHDADHIDDLRRMGVKAYYGDATRPELLHAAGIDNAKVIVAALDDRTRQLTLVEHVRRHHPHVHIIARAFDRFHVEALEEAGAHHIVRELFEASLDAGREALRVLGMTEFGADQMARAALIDDAPRPDREKKKRRR